MTYTVPLRFLSDHPREITVFYDPKKPEDHIAVNEISEAAPEPQLGALHLSDAAGDRTERQHFTKAVPALTVKPERCLTEKT